ncbi:MAG: YchJ family protein [Actinomycetota bacterium]
MNDGPCPCGSGATYALCCGPIHARGAGLGATAEQLMRARYTAYVRGDEGFLARSWHPDTRPDPIAPDPAIDWLGLTVLDTTGGTGFDAEGTVTFEARYELAGRRSAMAERSRFVRLDGAWVYVDGDGRPVAAG